MAQAKKPAVKTAVKKTTAKPAAKKTAAAKPTVKSAVKKQTVKKSDVKKPAVKTAAAKNAAKSAVKKPAAKKAAPVKKTDIQTASINKTVIKPTVKKPAPVGMEKHKPVDILDPNIKYRDLFEAYKQAKLPFAHGYIVSSFFDENSAYSIYEVVSYAGVKEIFLSDSSLRFISGGKKLHILVEPATYHNKHVEPGSRVEGEKIPQRWNELETIIAKNQSRIMIAKEPIETTGSFTILEPRGINFAVVFYQLPDMYESMARFFEESLNRQRKIPQSDARKAAQYVVDILKKHMGFEGEYS